MNKEKIIWIRSYLDHRYPDAISEERRKLELLASLDRRLIRYKCTMIDEPKFKWSKNRVGKYLELTVNVRTTE